jgi:preprotein translocase subunit SecE
MKEPVKKGVTEGSVSFLERTTRFLKEVKIEARKITWAQRKPVLMTSLMVIFFSLFIGAYLGILDVIYNFIISLMVK